MNRLFSEAIMNSRYLTVTQTRKLKRVHKLGHYLELYI